MGSQFGAQQPFKKTTVHEEFDETILSPRSQSQIATAQVVASPLVSSQYIAPIRSSRISYQAPLAASYIQPIRASRVSYGAPVTTAVTQPRVTRVSYSGPYTIGVNTSQPHFIGSHVVVPAHVVGGYSSYGAIASQPVVSQSYYDSFYPRQSYRGSFGGETIRSSGYGNCNYGTCGLGSQALRGSQFDRIPRTSFLNY